MIEELSTERLAGEKVRLKYVTKKLLSQYGDLEKLSAAQLGKRAQISFVFKNGTVHCLQGPHHLGGLRNSRWNEPSIFQDPQPVVSTLVSTPSPVDVICFSPRCTLINER